MKTITDKRMGKVTTKITVTNRIDQILAERGFITADQIRSINLENVLVDTGATRLCLPEDIINQLGLVLQGEVDVKTSAFLNAGGYNRIVTRYNRIVTRYNRIVTRCNRIVTRYNRIVTRCDRIVTRCNRIVTRCNRIVTRCDRIAGYWQI